MARLSLCLPVIVGLAAAQMIAKAEEFVFRPAVDSSVVNDMRALQQCFANPVSSNQQQTDICAFPTGSAEQKCFGPPAPEFGGGFSAQNQSCLSLSGNAILSAKQANVTDFCVAELHFSVINKGGIDLCLPNLRRNGLTDPELCAHHGWLVLTSGDSSYATRGGPTYAIPGMFGPIKMVSGAYDETFVDYTDAPAAVVRLGEAVDPGCELSAALVDLHASVVNASNVPYLPLSQNSNTGAAGAAVDALGYNLPQIPVLAPGIATRLDTKVTPASVTSPLESRDGIGPSLPNLYGLPGL